MKRLLTAMTMALMGVLVATAALAAPPSAAPGKNPLTCFGDPAACTSNGKTATIDTTGGFYAGVYLLGYNASFYGVRTGLITKLSNTFTGPLGIDPRWSIPIDDRDDATNPEGNGYTDYFVFTTFADCNNGFGLVDVINDATCTVYKGNTAYANWTAFVTANPNTYIALNDNYAFIIADGSGAPGVWTISNVQVGKPGK